MTNRVNKGDGEEKGVWVRALVSGRVQGVGFRQSAAREATRLGVTGWVRNTPDGRVELRAEGSRAQVEELLQWCGRGPALARVSEVAVVERGETEIAGATFEVRS